MSYRNGFYDLALDGFIGDFAYGPVTDGTSAVLWVLTRQGHDLTPLLGSDGGRLARFWSIREPLVNVSFS